jgi:hypothetical protein
MGRRGDGGRIPHLILLLLLPASLAIIPGCARDDPGTYANAYLHMLATALPAARIVESGTPLPALPPQRHGTADSGAGGLGEIDILKLRGCDLKRTLIRGNSQLGRYAKPSQRLLLVLDYLRTAPDCIDLLRQRGDVSLATTLEQSRAEKQQTLPQLIFNATLGSAGYGAFSASHSAARTYPPVARSTVVSSLAGIDRHVTRWLNGDYRADHREFELLLGEVAGGAIGTLLHTLSRQGESLATADRLLRDQLTRDPLCTANRSRRESTRLLAAAGRYFRVEVQARFTETLRRIVELQSALAPLENRLHDHSPQDYRRWRRDRDRQIEELKAVPSRHLALLARVMLSCAPP